MTRPKSKENKDLPQGLTYRKDRNYFEFTRIDGSKKKVGTDKAKAKRLAIKYNNTFRIDVELAHDLFGTAAESKTKSGWSRPIGAHLKTAFTELAKENDWADGTLENHTLRFNKIYEFFKDLTAISINLSNINLFLRTHVSDASNDTYNRYIFLLKKLFDLLKSEEIIGSNPAYDKPKKVIKQINSEDRNRLNIDHFKDIYNLAQKKGLSYLQVAMDLSLQLSHGVLEISKLKYTDIDEFIRIKRQKNKKSSASRVAIPLNEKLLEIVELSKQDAIESDYVVHYLCDQRYQSRPLSKKKNQITQLRSDKISREFSDLRDELGLFDHISERKERPGFHEIRALSIHLFDKQGYDAQKRAAHSSSKSTQTYKEGHENYNTVQDGVIHW